MPYDTEKLISYLDEALIRGEFSLKTKSKVQAQNLRFALYRRRGLRPIKIILNKQILTLKLDTPDNGTEENSDPGNRRGNIS